MSASITDLHTSASRPMAGGPWRSVVSSLGRWLCLAGLFLMISGDNHFVHLARWTLLPTPAAPPLYLMLLVAGGLCFAGAGTQSKSASGVYAVVKPLGLLLGAFLVSAIASDVPTLSMESFLSVLCIVAAGWAFALLLEDERFCRAIAPLVAIALLYLAVLVIRWRYDEGFNQVAYHVNNNAWFGKLQLAWVFNLFSPLLLAWSIAVPRRDLAALYASAWLLTGTAIYVLFSRMGLIVFSTTTLGVFILTLSHWRRTLALAIVTAMLGATVVGGTREMAGYVVSTIADPELNPGIALRLAIWRDTIRLFRSRPLVGHGLGTYDVVAFRLEDGEADPLYREEGWHAHNVFLHVLAETGLLGLTAWCYLWFWIIARMWRGWKRGAPRHRAPLTGAMWAVCAFLMLSATEVMIAARVYASLRMNLALVFIVVLGLSESARRTATAECATTTRGS